MIDIAPAFAAFATSQQLDIAALDTFAGGQQLGAGVLQGLVDQPVVAFAAVGLEVGQPGMFLTGFEADVQDLAVEAGRDSEPVDVIIRRDSVVAAPGVFIRRTTGVAQAKIMGVTHVHAFGFEVEPLVMVAAGIGLDGQQQLVGVAGVEHLDIATVEVGADLDGGQGHGHSLVA